MARGDLHTSAVFAAVIGAVLAWFGTKLFRRPVETTQKMIDFVRRGKPAPRWACAHPDTARPVIRMEGAFLVVLGLGLLMLAAYMWWLSRK